MLLGTQRIDENGHLEVGGCDTVALAKEFGTPLYVIDEAEIRKTIRAYRAAFDEVYPNHKIYYASKAFLTLAMARLVAQEGLCMDVASLGELYVALQAGFPPEKLALHGNNKSLEELAYAVDSGVGHIVLDNFYEIENLSRLARSKDKTVDVLVRAAPGVDPHTHRRIRTGQADTKFGFNIIDGSALEAVKMVLKSGNLTFRGIHCHVGSQLLDAETHKDATEIMVGLMADIVRETGVAVEVLNIGGGLGVRYKSDQIPPSYRELALKVTTALKEAISAAGLPYPQLQQEPGRSLVGEAGVTLYTVGAIKTVPIKEDPGTRTYVTIDGGMSDNPRPQLYDAVYECLLANKADETLEKIVTIAGKHCETDILIWNTLIASPAPGDLLAVQTTGAYNFVMASNYNRFLRPAVVFVNEGQADLVVKRDTLEQMIVNECIPERLR
ncbi:MAG: diaminopimelate decarboxylase [Chthonomonadaceae bacterium]|nr:diaminopimelate decarboxylase [Chthonomonadaceae bacterium]